MQNGLFCSLQTVFLQEVGKFYFFSTCQAGDSRNWLYLIMARWTKLLYTGSSSSRNYGKIGTLVFPATWQFRILPDSSSICWYPAEFWRTPQISKAVFWIFLKLMKISPHGMNYTKRSCNRSVYLEKDKVEYSQMFGGRLTKYIYTCPYLFYTIL